MKLYPLELSSRLVTNISRISRRLKMDVLVKEVATRDLDTLVVIGDGTPDDIAFGIIAFHLKGDKIAGIVKPKEEKRIDCVGLIPAYLKGNIRKIIFLMDQEDDKLSTIYETIHEGVKKIATGKIKVIDEESEKRLKVYECKYGSKEFELILVINGLDEIHTDKHSIEDHLLKAAELLSIEVGDFGNSKEAWNSIKDRHEDIFKKLKKKRKIVEGVFPQQIQGCKYLAEKL